MSDDPAAQVFPTAEVVDHLACQHVLHQRVDGEVAPLRSSVSPYERIHLDLEVPVAPAGRTFAPRHGYVEVLPLQRVDSETFAEAQRLADLLEY